MSLKRHISKHFRSIITVSHHYRKRENI